MNILVTVLAVLSGLWLSALIFFGALVVIAGFIHDRDKPGHEDNFSTPTKPTTNHENKTHHNTT